MPTAMDAIDTSLPDIRSLAPQARKTWLLEHKQPAFRAKQLEEWLWKKQAPQFDAMSNLSAQLRQELSAAFSLNKPRIHHLETSKDGTRKYILELAGGAKVESVLIPTETRLTACISSQAGCSLSCKFCGTGYLPLERNLQYYEIVDQIVCMNQEAHQLFGRGLSNVVYMGMGEPLLNYRQVMDSLAIVNSPDGLGMSPRRITLSTAGIAKMIVKLADDGFAAELALSLHAANDAKRSELMPINDTNNLNALAEALNYFCEKLNTRVTFEYIIFEGFNDTIDDADDLIDFCHRVPSKVNIIEYNPVAESGLRNTSGNKMHAFMRHLSSEGIIVNLRRSRGRDIHGGCGQLALRQLRTV